MAHEIQMRKLVGLRPYARNARTHSERQIAMVAKSIQEHGWIAPIIICPDGEILAGHGRYLAAKMLGMSEVPCLVVDGLTEIQRRSYRIADNRLAELADWDEDALRAELESLAGEIDALAIGYDEDEYARIIGTDDGPEETTAVEGDDISEGDAREEQVSVTLRFPAGSWPMIRDAVLREIERIANRYGGIVRSR